MAIRLSDYKPQLYSSKRVYLKWAVWYCFSILFESFIPGSGWRVYLLKCFGASIGHGVVIKPRVRVKYPWNLMLGDFVWIGEQVWIDNLDLVKINSNVCVSQGVYFCTGSHDWHNPAFSLITAPIHVESSVWICAFCKIAQGVHIPKNTRVSMGSIVTKKCKF